MQRGEYDNLDELAFYQDKFTVLETLFRDHASNKGKKSQLQSDVKNVLRDNFSDPHSGIRTPYEQPPEVKREEPARM